MTGCTVAAMVLLSVMLLADLDERPGAAATKLWISALFWVPFGRLVRDLVQRNLRRHGHLMAPTLIIGDGPVTEQVVGRMVAAPEHGLKPSVSWPPGGHRRVTGTNACPGFLSSGGVSTTSTRRSGRRMPKSSWSPSRSRTSSG